MIEITAESVRELRDAQGCSMMEAKEILVKQQIVETVQQAETLEDLKPVLLWILHKI
jgi:translation elongation factor EF-Ts